MNLQYYKQHVSIIQLVESLGYTLNRSKGRYPKQYEHPNGDKVIIYDNRNSPREAYFTRNNYGDKGSAVDFVKNRLSMFNVHYNSEWEGVLKVLSEYSNTSHTNDFTRQALKRKRNEPKSKFDPGLFEVKSANLEDLSYLTYERNINEKTLNRFLPYIQTVRKKDRPYTNIGLPYKQPGKDQVVGYELVNFDFKGHAPGSQRKDAVWMANMSHAPQLVNQVFIGESAIDAMSFYQLNQHKFNFEHAVFVSTGGNVLRNQARNILKAFPQAKINTLFDNDLSGKLYDIYLAGIKTNKELQIRKTEDAIQFELKKGIFEVPVDQLSLSRFERVTGIRSGIRPIKAHGKDFNEMLQKRNESNVELKTTNRPKR
jgi:hypothetical protein